MPEQAASGRGGWHIAQLNVARMRAPIDDPLMADFVAQLETINALADRSPGFVWRLQTEDGDATGIRAFGDEPMLVNMSVWESVEALHAYVYRSAHLGVMRDRRRWFDPMAEPHLVLWWVRAGELPSVEEAVRRLRRLTDDGPGPRAFTFGKRFPPPGEPGADASPLAADCGG